MLNIRENLRLKQYDKNDPNEDIIGKESLCIKRFAIRIIYPMMDVVLGSLQNRTPATYLGWKSEKYLFVHGMSWANRTGRTHPSPDQSTTDVFQLEDTLAIDSIRVTLHSGHWLWTWKSSTQRYHVIMHCLHR